MVVQGHIQTLQKATVSSFPETVSTALGSTVLGARGSIVWAA
jgi:hypothetical protein